MVRDGGILVVDVGTTKICALIGEERDGKLWVTGMGVSPALGLKRGGVVNIEEATQSIKNAVERAKTQAKVMPNLVFTSIAGSHIKIQSGMGVVALREKEVTPQDVEEVLNSAQLVDISQDKILLHVIPQEFVVDQTKGITQPVGMTGIRLEAHVLLITAQRSHVQNLLRCFENIGYEVDGVIFQGLASAEAVLTPEEKDLGVLLIDFGGGTSDLVVYKDGVLRFAGSVPVGGELLTGDLAVCLRTTKAEAERLKIEKGVCLRELVGEEEFIEVPGIGNRPSRSINKKILAEILEERVRELLVLIDAEIKNFPKTYLTSGVVLTGGSVLLPGLIYLCDQILDLPARIGYPERLSGLTEEIYHPRYSTAVGMLLYAYQNYAQSMQKRSKKEGWWRKLKQFLKI
ncbi:MAG: cell division protein FtsA [Caldimicrobium sp.]|nr:cell division protein FtsA [Caldimicrobium sp.]MCX7873498.1 cell division protein FtsA [Caldimicrobium sp.]MDW8093824.1 cell division protein FtsA [Caldimicrobium sp.]